MSSNADNGTVIDQQPNQTNAAHENGTVVGQQPNQTDVALQQGLDALKAQSQFQYQSINFADKSPIPDNWIKVACCAFRFDNLDFPTCLGFKSGCQVCCFQCTSYSCNPIVNSDRACLVCNDDIVEIVSFQPTLYCYRQCCCIELAVGLPALEGYVEMKPSVDQNLDFEAADPSFVYPCTASCCTIDSIFLKYPECIGCFSKGFCCCIEGGSTSCKPLFLDESRSNKDLLCLLTKGYRYCVPFNFGCWSSSQTFCCDSRGAFPCNEGVPCLYTAAFITCCVNFQPHIAVFSNLADLLTVAKGIQLPSAVQNATAQLKNASESAAAKGTAFTVVKTEESSTLETNQA